jgi:hypothetical protein
MGLNSYRISLKHPEDAEKDDRMGFRKLFDIHGFREKLSTRGSVRRDCDAIVGLEGQEVNNATSDSLETNMTNQ